MTFDTLSREHSSMICGCKCDDNRDMQLWLQVKGYTEMGETKVEKKERKNECAKENKGFL